MRPHIKKFKSLNEACRDLAQHISNIASHSIKKRNRFTMALSGGKTPVTLHETLAHSPFTEKIDWHRTHLFWGDDRWLPPTDPDSNYAMAKATLLDHIDIPNENIYPIPSHLADPVAGAADYERTIKRFFSADTTSPFPALDIILLGMGADGHTASLFPKHEALTITDRWVVDVTSPHASPKVPRLTLTLPVINQARHIIFLITGKSKKNIMTDIIADSDACREKYPAAHIRPVSGNLLWYYSD